MNQEVKRILPENDDGNKEYKLKLINKDKENIEHIASQMRYRLEEGNGEAIYTIGVTDSGEVVGLSDDEYKTTKEILDQVAGKNNYSITLVCEYKVDENKKMYEFLIRELNNNRYINISVACAGNVDAGKCLAKNTKVRLFSGNLKKVQDITTEDYLMGDDGTARKILQITKGYGEMYKIIPKNGQSFTVNKNHILCFKTSNCNYVYYDNNTKRYVVRCFIWKNSMPKITTVFFPLKSENRKFYNVNTKFYDSKEKAKESANIYLNNSNCIKREDIIELSLEQYINLDKYTQNALKLYRVSVEYVEKDIPFDAYNFGYWIGTDTKNIPQIKVSEPEIIEYLQNANSLIKTINMDYTIFSFENNQFIKDCCMSEKHIPDIFKYNCRGVRINILRGLIDSIGYLEKNGKYSFKISKENECLVNDIVEVARSLGFASYKKYCNNK